MATTKTAAQKNVNSKESMKTNNKGAMTQADIDRAFKKAGEDFAKQKKVKVKIPKVYRPKMGQTITVGVNGVIAILEIDKEYHLPESFNEVLQNTLDSFE